MACRDASQTHPLARVYDAAYTSVPNWDIGRPQRPFVALQEAGLVEDPVLDVGCGTGELSLYLARQGNRVLGIDISPRAIEQARAKARWRRIPAEFLVLDALRLDRLADAGFRFRTVLDCAMLHVLGDSERERFVDGLETVIEPGGLYCVLGDARRDDTSAYGLSAAALTDRFESRGGWAVAFRYETRFERRYSSNPAYFLGLRRR